MFLRMPNLGCHQNQLPHNRYQETHFPGALLIISFAPFPTLEMLV